MRPTAKTNHPIEDENLNQKRKKYKQKYRRDWEATIKWILPLQDEPFKAFCIICHQKLSCSGGLYDLQRHSAGAKHMFFTKNPKNGKTVEGEKQKEEVKNEEEEDKNEEEEEEESDQHFNDSLFEAQIDYICRICLQRNEEMCSIFDVDDSEMSFAQKIMQATTLVIEQDTDLSLPTQICPKCIGDLEVAFQFRMTCESSDTVLQMYAPQKPIITMDVIEEEPEAELEVEPEQKYVPDVVPMAKDTVINDFKYEPENDEMWGNQDAEEILCDVSLETSQPLIQSSDVKIKRKIKSIATVERRPRMTRGRTSYICDYCGRKFMDRHEFEAHIRRHTGDRPFQCEVCNKSFTIKASLKVHDRIHTGERPFTCRHCPKTFNNVSCRIAHERIHTGEKRHICSVCGMAFTHRFTLTRHSVVHTGTKNFTCKYCEKKFATLGNLRQHERVHLREFFPNQQSSPRDRTRKPRTKKPKDLPLDEQWKKGLVVSASSSDEEEISQEVRSVPVTDQNVSLDELEKDLQSGSEDDVEEEEPLHDLQVYP